VVRVVSCSPLTSTVGVTNRTGLPTFCGTCKLSLCGFCDPFWSDASIVVGDTAEAGVGGKRKWGSCPGGSDCARSTIGVRLPGFRFMSIVGPSLVLGFAGNVTNGPSRTDRLLGGRPRSLPVDVVLLLGQADETAGPCRRRERGLELEGVTADCGSSKKSGCADWGVTADSGCGVCGSWEFSRHRSCWPDIGEAEYGVRFLFGFIRPGADAVVMAEAGVMADAVHGSFRNPSMLSGWALLGYADCGCNSFPNGIDVFNCGRFRGGVPSFISMSSSPSSAFRRPRFGLNLGSSALIARSSSSGTPSRPFSGKGACSGGICM
jgi:hypothetical protein